MHNLIIILLFFISIQANAETIPKIFHRTWFAINGEQLSDQYLENDRKLKELHPGWTIKYWNEDDADLMVEEHFPEFYPIFINYDLKFKKIDAFRYVLMYLHGGVTIDYSFYPLKNIEPLIKNHENRIITARECNSEQSRVNPAFMASAPENRLWLQLLATLPSKKDLDTISATGPEFFRNFINSLSPEEKEKIIVLENKYLYPICPSTKAKKSEEAIKCYAKLEECSLVFPQSYAIKQWGQGWIKEVRSQSMVGKILSTIESFF